MAVTIKSAPAAYTSAQGDIIFVVYEAVKANDPVTYPDYKYVADIYIGATMVARLKAVPRPDNKMGVFTIGDIIRGYVSATFNPAYGDVFAQEMALNDFFIKATIKFGEEYGFTLYTNLTVDSERTYYNHYNGRLLGEQTILADYLNIAASNRPVKMNLMSGNDNNFIPYLPSTTTPFSVLFSSYDMGNNLVNSITGDIITPTSANALQIINASPTAINAVSPGFINNDTRYFTVQIGNQSVFRFDLICEPRYEIFNVHFLNKFGGFESREFIKVSRKTIAITKTDFGKLPYNIDISGRVSYYNSNNVYNETRATYASQYTDKLTLNSDVLSDDEYIWLGQLILSPLVYIEMSGYFVPCTIVSTTYEFKKHINDKLAPLTINIEFGEMYNAQYR